MNFTEKSVEQLKYENSVVLSLTNNRHLGSQYESKKDVIMSGLAVINALISRAQLVQSRNVAP